MVFDFSRWAGKAIELRNYPNAGNVTVEENYQNTDKFMCFDVSGTAVQVDNSTQVPDMLRTIPYPQSSTPNTVNHRFRFHRANNGDWQINGVGFADAKHRVLADVPRGTVEIWQLENNSDRGSHPVHVHLVDFRVVERRGARGVMPYESAGLKDVVWLGKGETAIVEAHYASWDGVYMFHCHNLSESPSSCPTSVTPADRKPPPCYTLLLVHEDQDMMAAFNVTALVDFGYEETAGFADPMEDRWRAKKFSGDEFATRTGPFSERSIRAMVEEYTTANPYSDVNQVMNALDDYWKVKQSPGKARW